MLFTTHRVVCDECVIEELPIEAVLMENVQLEIKKSGWQSTGKYISAQRHICPGCQKKKGGE